MGHTMYAHNPVRVPPPALGTPFPLAALTILRAPTARVTPSARRTRHAWGVLSARNLLRPTRLPRPVDLVLRQEFPWCAEHRRTRARSRSSGQVALPASPFPLRRRAVEVHRWVRQHAGGRTSVQQARAQALRPQVYPADQGKQLRTAGSYDTAAPFGRSACRVGGGASAKGKTASREQVGRQPARDRPAAVATITPAHRPDNPVREIVLPDRGRTPGDRHRKPVPGRIASSTPVDLPENPARGDVWENHLTIRGESPTNLLTDGSVGDRPLSFRAGLVA